MPCSIILVSSLSIDFKKLKRVRKDCSEELYFFLHTHLLHFNVLDSCSMHCFAAYPMNHVSDAAAQFSHPAMDALEAVEPCSSTWTTNLNLCRSAVKILWLFFLLCNVHTNPLNINVISFLSINIAVWTFTVLKRPSSSKQSFLLKIPCNCIVVQRLHF